MVKKDLKKFKNYNIVDINDTVDNVIRELRLAKKDGQIMGNRLRKYRYAIEGLGFIRENRTE